MKIHTKNKLYILLLIILPCLIFSQTTINVQDPYLKNQITYVEVNTWKDGSLMTDTKVDGTIFIKKANQYYKRIYDGKINIKWFGASGDGKKDDSKAIQTALNYGESVFFPAGTYKFNAVVPKHIEIEGNSGNTYLQPFDIQKPVLIYDAKNPYWTYSGILSNVIFKSENKKGIAVSFGEGKLADKKTSDEYAGNVTFRNVLFTGFYQAILYPFGNIGCNFFSCSFQNNNYGIYSIDNKMGGDIMHAGNKYFYACEFDSNNIAVYFHNVTDGFGGVSFTDCIFQANSINAYFYTTNTYIPISFQNCWDEKGSAIKDKIAIDQYNGKEISKKMYDPASFIFEGSSSSYIFIGGRVMNMNILGENIVVNSYSSKFEFQQGVGAEKFTISEKSKLKLHYPTTEQGIQTSSQIEIVGFPQFSKNALTVSYANPEARFIPLDRKNISFSNAENFALKTNKPISMSGSFSPKTATIEKKIDGKNFSSRLQLDFNQKNQFISVDNTKQKLQKGYYFIALDLKVNQGQPLIFIWDRNQNQFVRFKPIYDAKNHAYGAYGYLPNEAEIYLDISSTDARPVDISLDSYKVFKFDSMQKLREFMLNNISEN